MDKKDRQILRELQSNGRMTNNELAKQANLVSTLLMNRFGNR